MSRPRVIAIDGPGGVGKTAVGSLLARRLGYRFIDTGAMYRALAWLALEHGVSPKDAVRLGELAWEAELDLQPSEQGEPCRVFIGGREVTAETRQPRVEAVVSQVSKVPAVRAAMVSRQRSLARQGRVVMAGRDIGTVVLPQADLKLFLVASPRERAQRRHRELEQRGDKGTLEAVLAELERRDQIDRERPVAPLRPAPDARIVDTEGLTLEQVVDQVLRLAGDPWGSSTG